MGPRAVSVGSKPSSVWYTSWATEVATAHEAFVRCRRATVTVDATAEQLVAVGAARAEFESLREKSMARATCVASRGRSGLARGTSAARDDPDCRRQGS